jgi:hypothetical protein
MDELIALREQVRAIRDLVLSYGDKNDATAWPVWGIVKKAGLGQHDLLSGPWFNRDDAEAFLEAKRYRYGYKAFVYCFSAHDAWHMRKLQELVKALPAQPENTGGATDESQPLRTNPLTDSKDTLKEN